MDINEYLKKWSEKLSLSVEEIQNEFNKFADEEKNIHPDLSEEERNKRALQRLALIYKKQLRSPAIGFEGIIIGIGDCIDIVAKQKREAIELYKTDPQTAINDGITNEEGVPLDTRREWANGKANNSYGKPLPDNNFLRNVFGIAVKSKISDATNIPKLFTMTINGQKATDENIPTFKPLRFMAIDKSQQPNTYKLNASQFTNFTVDDKMILPNFKTLISSCCEVVKLSELESYHTLNKEDFNRIVIIEGDVSMVNLEPTMTGSRVMYVEDGEALEDLDAKGLTCWLPERINVDFAEGSKVLIAGRTAQGKKKDELGNITDELGDITMNVYGLYALPEYKINLPKSIQSITEESLDIE